MTGDELSDAVDTLFQYRVSLDLETDTIPDPIAVDTSSCSAPTQDAIQAYVDQINAGRSIVAENFELDTFYRMIYDFIQCGDSPCE